MAKRRLVMASESSLLDVLTVIETKKVVHAAHPTQATKPDYVAPSTKEEDVMQCVGKARLMEDGILHIHLKAFPLNGRLIIRLPR
jgi:hypothetical protein